MINFNEDFFDENRRWRDNDHNFEENFRRFQGIVNQYKGLDWKFMERYFVDCFCLLNITYNPKDIPHAKDFFTIFSSNVRNQGPLVTYREEERSSGNGLTRNTERVLVPEFNRMNTVRDTLLGLQKEHSIAGSIQELVLQKSNDGLFQSVFGESPPPPENFKPKKIVMLDKGYLEMITWLGLPCAKLLILEKDEQ